MAEKQSSLSKLQARAEEARQRLAEKEETPAQMFLRGMSEIKKALPNSISDSSLFAPVARGRKRMHTGTVLASRANTTLQYWGVQLNELHADIVMLLISEQQRQGAPVGAPVTLNRANFFSRLGWGESGREYKRFDDYMLDLAVATLIIKSQKPDGAGKYHVGATRTFRILEGYESTERGEHYRYRLDPRWVILFGNREYSLIDWPARLAIGAGLDMAKTLQRVVATSADRVQRYALERLKDQMQYRSPMRKYKESLSAACDELQRLKIIRRYEIGRGKKGEEQLVIWL